MNNFAGEDHLPNVLIGKEQMQMTENEVILLTQLEEAQVISTSEKNLRSKIDSIVRSLENLSKKRARIDFEIKRQKKSLTRKRQELKKVSSSTQVKAKLTLESTKDFPGFRLTDRRSELRVLDSKLLQESSRVLDD